MTISVIVVIVILFFAASSYALARLSRRAAKRVSRWLRMLLSALLLPVMIFVAGFIAYEESSIVDWIFSRSVWAWANLTFLVLTNFLAAWLALRGERSRLDAAIFD